jgi:hypothetical protein
MTLDRRVRKQLPADKDYDNYPDWYFGFGRTIMFAYASIWERYNNSSLMKAFYNGFDVKGFANPFEKFMAYCFCFGLLVTIGGGIILYAIEFVQFLFKID